MNQALEKYYAERASEYDNVYQKPERQKDLTELSSALSVAFESLDVLEIACGTGYWTQFIARGAASVFATDYNPEVIEIAKSRNYHDCQVSFLLSDAYILENVMKKFSAGFCGFWWSHVAKGRIKKFLEVFHSQLYAGSKVVIIDNRYVEGSSTPIARKSEEGDTYQLRKLENSSTYEILKNFPTEVELISILEEVSSDLELKFLQYYWMVNYKTK